MPDDNVRQFPQVQQTDDEERIFKIGGELDVIKKRLLHKDTKPKSLEDLIQFIGRSLLPLVIETAHYTKENTAAVFEIWEEMDGGGGTQFTAEDAELFDLVLTYAFENTSMALADERLCPPGSEAHQKMTEVRDKAQRCLAILKENVIGGGDDAEGAEEDDGGEGG